ncbi:hypothetical protein BOX15_Mlig022756g1, partial [Macrostomum lignano]
PVQCGMAPKGFRCTAEITIELVVSPGTWLPHRDDVYLTIDFLNQVKRSRLVAPVFPLRVHERFRFEKNFWPASDPRDVVDRLEELPIAIELRQATDAFRGSRLLAYFDSDGREFLFPSAPTSKPACHTGREALMARTVDFSGVSPKLEFCTYTVVQELRTSYSGSVGDDFGGEVTQPRRSAAAAIDSVDRRARRHGKRPPSMSKVDDSATAAAGEDRRAGYRTDDRPPFVVRHVADGLTGRKPVLHNIRTRLRPPRQLMDPEEEALGETAWGYQGGRSGGGGGGGGSADSSPTHRRRADYDYEDYGRRGSRRRRASASRLRRSDSSGELWYYERPYAPFAHEYPEWGEAECLAPGSGSSLMDSRYNPVLASSLRHRTADRYGEAPAYRSRRPPLRDSQVY